MFGHFDRQEAIFGSLLLLVVVFHDEHGRDIAIQSHAALVAILGLVGVDIEAGLGLVVGSQNTPPPLSATLHDKNYDRLLLQTARVFTTKPQICSTSDRIISIIILQFLGIQVCTEIPLSTPAAGE